MTGMTGTTDSRKTRAYRLGELTCETCGEQAALFATGWRTAELDEAHSDELPALAFYCPHCAPPERAAA